MMTVVYSVCFVCLTTSYTASCLHTTCKYPTSSLSKDPRRLLLAIVDESSVTDFVEIDIGIFFFADSIQHEVNL